MWMTNKSSGVRRVQNLERQSAKLFISPDGEYAGTVTLHRAGCGRNHSEQIEVTFLSSMPASMRTIVFSHDLLRGRWQATGRHAWLRDVKARLIIQ